MKRIIEQVEGVSVVEYAVGLSFVAGILMFAVSAYSGHLGI